MENTFVLVDVELSDKKLLRVYEPKSPVFIDGDKQVGVVNFGHEMVYIIPHQGNATSWMDGEKAYLLYLADKRTVDAAGSLELVTTDFVTLRFHPGPRARRALTLLREALDDLEAIMDLEGEY